VIIARSKELHESWIAEASGHSHSLSKPINPSVSAHASAGEPPSRVELESHPYQGCVLSTVTMGAKPGLIVIQGPGHRCTHSPKFHDRWGLLQHQSR